ncbi:carnosine N-methyltransferase 2-like [Varanus komodoensis]|uniref:carnosine N-methyltransferase 2-like n=1 Tax=Varanus komodoensis TaxID=61221 RepID=UPI001CF786FE|nr:carnosine N-methyltransferase 2-like [Varanus komodoensis]
MEPRAMLPRVFKAGQGQIGEGCLRVSVLSKGFCPMHGAKRPVIGTTEGDDECDRRIAPDASLEREILMTPPNNSEICVTQPMRSLTVEEYTKAFKSFLNTSTEHQCMEQFNKEELPNIVASLGNGRSTINVLGVGSGTGEQDLNMIRLIQAKHPGILINNEVIEPNPQHILTYKDAVRNSSDLKNVSFTWHQLTSMEYEKQARAQNIQKKFDFIHLIQMLYRVEDIVSTVRFFHSCLDSYAKLLIIIISGNSGWASIWRKYRHCLPPTDSGHYITSDDIEPILKDMGLNYQVYNFPSTWDITECFIDGDTIGGHTLDFLTGTKDFMNTAPHDLKQCLRQALCQPECSTKKDGRIVFRNDLSMIVISS